MPLATYIAYIRPQSTRFGRGRGARSKRSRRVQLGWQLALCGFFWVAPSPALILMLIKEGALALERVADHLASSRFPSCILRVLGVNGQAALHFFASRPPALAEWIVAQAQQQ
jgi:hypothetical protein